MKENRVRRACYGGGAGGRYDAYVCRENIIRLPATGGAINREKGFAFANLYLNRNEKLYTNLYRGAGRSVTKSAKPLSREASASFSFYAISSYI